MPCFSKILEKIIYKRIVQHSEANSVLYKHQYGFRKHHSTYMALLHLTDKIISSQHNNEFTCCVFLDLSKAFDTVDHSVLLGKLNKYGFHGSTFKWLNNYISDRRQFVCVNGCNSNLASLPCGLPQGSILGPLLFLVYINDLSNVSKKMSPIMFADDTTLILSNTDFATLITDTNTGLAEYASWFKLNKLSLNIKKSNYMFFCGKKHHPKDVFKIKLDSTELPRVSSSKFLGVIVDENLSWREHVDWISSKVNKSIGIIRKVSHLITTNCLMTLYYSLIYPYLSYCNIV